MRRAVVHGASTIDVVVTLVERQFRIRRKRTLVGVLWPVVAPFALAALYVFVFRSVFRTTTPRYVEFLLCGLVPWGFLAMAVGRAATAITADQDLVRKIGRRSVLLPISVTLEHALNLLVTVGILVVFLAVQGDLPLATLPWLPFPLAATVLLTLALGLLVALVDVYNHDLKQLLPNLLTIWFFLVPIVYQPTMAPSSVTFLRSVDPMNLVVGQMRSVLYFGRVDEPGKMVLMVVLAAAAFAVALLVFQRAAAEVPKDA